MTASLTFLARPASTKYTSATASHSATVAAWQPGPAGPVRGKASIPTVFIHAQRTALVQIFLHDPSASTGPTAPIRITPLSFAIHTNCKKKQPPHPKRRAAVAAEDCGATNYITTLLAVAGSGQVNNLVIY